MKFNALLVSLLSATSVSAFAPHTSFAVSSIVHTSSYSSSSSQTRLYHGPPKEPKHAPKHDTGMQIEISDAEKEIQARFAEHQQNAPKLNFATDVRTLIEYNHGFAVMSTNSKSNEGYPNGSVVGFAPDSNGNPIFIFSGMSSHTQDVLKDPKCSLTIASKQFKGAADGRVNLMGQVKLVPSEERDALKAVYLKKHPGAFWVEFGDFNWFRMEIEKINFVGGFARAGSVTPEEYSMAKPDAISEFGPMIGAHMNEDHQDSTIAMIESQVPGIAAKEAIITSVDSLGMFVKVTRSPDDSEQEQTFKMRLPFPRKAENRKDVKDIIVEMTRAAAAAAAAATGDKEEETASKEE